MKIRNKLKRVLTFVLAFAILCGMVPANATVAFQDSTAVAKIQQGSAWWFNDHKTGMQDQMISLANLGNLSGFVGMLTDSRSFLSYTRHDYFRRILCNLFGTWVENGEYPDDDEILGEIVKGICYNNAVKYFGFNLKPQKLKL